MDYYNEFDKYPAAWLRNLQAAGHISEGRVDERSIVDVEPGDLEGIRQAHFFAGIGGWPLALKLAGWPGDQEVWTGSCPCQPFSICGKKKGTSDDRHLWPSFLGLIAHRRPPVVFGEQVASPAGRKWLAGVRADLEELGYRVGSSDLCAAGVGAPHIRQRLYWVADTEDSDGWSRISRTKEGARSEGIRRRRSSGGSSDDWTPERMGISCSTGLEERQGCEVGSGAVRNEGEAARQGGPWGNYSWVTCRDGRTRRFKPGVLPLAHGVPARMGKLRAYGNAIVPQVAATFVKAYLEAKD